MGRYKERKKIICAFLAALITAWMHAGCDMLHTGDTMPSNTEYATAPSYSETTPPPSEPDTEVTVSSMSAEESVSILLSEICSDLTGEAIDPVSRSDDAAFVANGSVSVNESIDSFISSSYYESLGLSDEDFVRKCYLAFTGNTAGEYTVRFLLGMLTQSLELLS